MAVLFDMPFGKDQNFHNLMKKCWEEDPAERYTFKTIKGSIPKLLNQQ